MADHRTRARWLEDQILAALREGNPDGMTTGDICRAICPHCRERSIYCHYPRVYQRLRSMAQRNLVIWHDWVENTQKGSVGESRTTWELVAVVSDDLEEIWNMAIDRGPVWEQ